LNKSETINELAAALAKAQAEMQNPGFDSQNPHFKSKFASLASVRNAIVPVLAKHGIALSQDITNGERGPKVSTILQHSSGQWIEYGPLEMPVSKPDAQGVGSATTYGRRYHMMAVAGVVGDEDDDGNAASKPKTVEQQMVAANIQPTAGVKEAMPQDVMSRLVDKMTSIKDTFKINPGKAYQEYMTYRDTLVGDADRGAAFVSLLDAPMRTQFRKFREEAQTAQSA
jgi:hypothetical protein